MAARTTKISPTDAWKARIQTTMLVKRLNQNALEGEIMTPGQIRSAEILLKKVIPDLKAIEHSGADGGPVKFQIDIKFS